MRKMDKNDTIMDRVRLSAVVRHLSLVTLLGLFCLLPAANSFAQSSNRWLFVFNTSAAMRDRTNGMQAVTQDLLNTAMHGNLRAGDTIGIWTYNSELHADEAPLQTWSSNMEPAIAYNTLLFLQQHSFAKSAKFDNVLANMLRVIKISDTITIILFSDGAENIKGTPFDAQLTAFYKANYQSQKKAHLPVVTVLRGEKGVLTTNTLGLALAAADIPQVPPPAPVKAMAQKPAPVASPPPKPVPSLVIIGKKAETTFNVPTDLPDHSGEPSVQPPTAPPPTEAAPVVAKTETPAPPAPEPAPAPKVESKPVVATTTPSAPVVATPSPAPSVAEEPVKTVLAREISVPHAPATNAPGETVAPATSAPTQIATVTPEKNLFSGRNIGIVSVVFTLLVCTLLILSARNARRAARASLITRSLDRERE